MGSLVTGWVYLYVYKELNEKPAVSPNIEGMG